MKILPHIKHRAEILLGFVVIFVIASIPADALDLVVGTLWGILAASVVLLIGVSIWRYKKRALIFMLAALCVCSVRAEELEDCGAENTTQEERVRCVYNYYRNKFGGDICSYVRKFSGSTRVRTGKEEDEMLEVNQNAMALDQAFSKLPAAEQNLVKCVDETTGKPTSTAKNEPVCCAKAMESAYERYTAQHPPRGIESVPSILSQPNMQCWPCDVVFLLVTIINTLSYKMGPLMSRAALQFLAIAFQIWLMYKAVLLILGKLSGSEFFSSFIKCLLAVMLVAFILNDIAKQANSIRSKGTKLDAFYTYIVNPPFEMIAGMGIHWAQRMTKNTDNMMGRVIKKLEEKGDLAAVRRIKMVDYCENSSAIQLRDLYKVVTGSGVSSALKKKEMRVSYRLDYAARGHLISENLESGFLCMTQMTFNSVAPLSAIGSLLVTHAVQNAKPVIDTFLLKFGPRIPLLPQLFYGFALQLAAWLFGVIVAFQLIDICLRLCFSLLLAPIFLAAAAIPETVKYAKNGLNCLFNAVMGFIQIAFAVALTAPLMYRAVVGDAHHEAELMKAIVAPYSSKYVSNLYDVLTENGAKFFLVLTVSCIFSYIMFENAKQIFGKVFGIKGGSSPMNMSSQDVRAGIGQTAMGIGTVASGSKAVSQKIGGKVGNKLANTKAGRAVGNKMVGAKAAISRAYQGSAVDRAVQATKRGAEALGNTWVGKGARFLGRNGAAFAKAAGGAMLNTGVNAVRKAFYMDPKSRKKYEKDVKNRK